MAMRVLSCLGIVFLLACAAPTARAKPIVGSADHSGGIANVGSDTSLSVPLNFIVKNNKTAKEKYLDLEWDTIPDATGYRVYRAVYPTYLHTGDLEDRAYKLLSEITQLYPRPTKMFYRHNIPEVPLRRYAYRVTAVRYWGESNFSQTITGHRLPVSATEALMDMDYNMHFPQSSIPDFGGMNVDEMVLGRASGSYEYASQLAKKSSKFTNYADFEMILNGDPKIDIILNPIGIRMSGDVFATGLYTAKMTYENLTGAVGGLVQGGNILIEYDHPDLGNTRNSFNYKEANKFMKTVPITTDDIFPSPPRREWDESDPNYVRQSSSNRQLKK